MITIQTHEIDFDITAPEDLQRYIEAGEKMTAAADSVTPLPQNVATPADMQKYMTFLHEECRLITDFIDEAFGDGICNKLLGKKTSLEKLLDVCDAIGTAVEDQARRVGVKIQKYTPNRKARRAQK